MNSMESNLQTPIDSLYMTIAYTLLDVNFSARFYIYTVRGEVFRKDFKSLLFLHRVMNN